MHNFEGFAASWGAGEFYRGREVSEVGRGRMSLYRREERNGKAGKASPSLDAAKR